MEIPEEETIADYYSIKSQLEKYNGDIRAVITHPRFCLPFLQPGRLIKVSIQLELLKSPKASKQTNKPNNHSQIRDGDNDFGWGSVVSFQKKLPTTKKGEPLPSETDQTKYVVDVLLSCDGKQKVPTPCAAGEKGEMLVVPCMLTSVERLSSIRIYIPKDLKTPDSRQSVQKSIQEVNKRFPDGVPPLDPIEDMNIEDEAFKKIFAVTLLVFLLLPSSVVNRPHLWWLLSQKIEALEAKLKANPLTNSPQLKELYQLYDEKVQLDNRIKTIRKEIKQATSIMQMEELKCRKRVLRRLGFTTASDVIDMKGRVACEISTGDELLLTEMIFNGAFNDLTVDQTCALLSCFVFEEKVAFPFLFSFFVFADNKSLNSPE